MSTRSLWMVVLMCLPATRVSAADPVFQFSKDVQSPALAQEELLSVTLDADVYAATQDALLDLRLLDADDHPVAYVRRKVQTSKRRKVRKTWVARQPSVRPLDDGGLEIIVPLGPKDPHPNGLTLVSPLRNFEKRVHVETSADGSRWEPVGQETLIFDYSRYMDVRRDSVVYPETERRRFRIVIDDVTAQQESELLELTRRLRGGEETERVERFSIERRPFRIDRVDFWREVERETPDEDVKRAYPPVRFQVEQDEDKQQSVILIDSRREPLTSLTLETPSRNFSRSAAVEIEDVDGVRRTWHSIGQATVSRIDFKDLQREQLSITFPESRHERYRIVIENRDSPPLEIAGVAAEGNQYELAFLAAPDERYRLVYGDADAKPVDQDTAAMQSLLRSGFDVTSAELGEQQPNPGAGQRRRLPLRDLLLHPAVLGSVIALLVIALGFGLYQAVKRMDAEA